jgi:tetratricopeptide (TPR) repeat protein
MKRTAILLSVLVSVYLSLPSSARLQTRRQPPATVNQQAPAEIEPLLKTAVRQLQNKNYLPAYQSARQALALSEERGDKARQARATHLLAIAAFHTGRTSEAIRLFKQTSINADEAGIGALQMTALTRAGALLLMSGRLLHGEGIIGLTRAFLYAGAESVVVSLWNVNDIATASLMKAFYRNLQAGLSKGDALRQAKLELLRGQQAAWRHPYYWAPFVLVGEARLPR